MAERLRRHDWASTPLGPLEQWPRSLRVAVDLMLDSSLPTYIAWGPQRTSLYNDGYVPFVGGEDALGRPYEHVWPSIADEYRPLIESTLQGQSHHFVDVPFDFGDGAGRRWFTYAWTPLRDDDGRIAGLLSQAIETTDKVRAEQALLDARERALREVEDRYRSLLDSIDQGFCVVQVLFDADGRPADYLWVETNRMFEQQTGLRDVLGRTVQEVVPNIEPFWIETYGRVAVSGEPLRFEQHSPAMDRWFDVYAWRRGAAEQHHVALLFSDATARKRNELELRASEERFRLMADAAPQIVWITDGEGRAEFFNRRWTEFTGHAFEPGRAHTMGAVIHPDDLSGAVERWDAARAGACTYMSVHRLRAGNGEYRWFLARAEPRRDPVSGEIRQWFGVSTDIHDRKLAEDALAEAGRRKDEFLAMLAHELRNPLAPIATAAELLPLVAEQPERVRDAGRIIARQARHMSRLVDELLDVSRVTRGLIRLEQGRVALADVIASAVEQVRPLLEQRQHRLQLHGMDDTVAVHGDRTRLTQVLVNLLTNAARYTPEHGNVQVCLSADADHARIDVVDDGIGVPADLLPHLFEPFVQGDRGADRHFGGLGLGLALVRQLVLLHGGRVEAVSEGPGRGSRFSLQLPRADRADATAPLADAAAPAACRVLIVDDNIDAADSLALLLRLRGHLVDTAADAATALASPACDHAEVFVLDIGLPGTDGIELARRLRQRRPRGDAVLIALTGYGQTEDRERALAAGFDHHLVKPVEPAMLLRLFPRSDGPATASR